VNLEKCRKLQTALTENFVSVRFEGLAVRYGVGHQYPGNPQAFGEFSWTYAGWLLDFYQLMLASG
jgi:hypothetical protein